MCLPIYHYPCLRNYLLLLLRSLTQLLAFVNTTLSYGYKRMTNSYIQLFFYLLSPCGKERNCWFSLNFSSRTSISLPVTRIARIYYHRNLFWILMKKSSAWKKWRLWDIHVYISRAFRIDRKLPFNHITRVELLRLGIMLCGWPCRSLQIEPKQLQ